MDRALFQENERLTPKADSRRFHLLGDFVCESGKPLSSGQVAYETWGQLNEDKSNAILVCHALSGDSHCLGWWSRLFGEGKPIDPEKWFIIGTNTLGGCQGSTGPGTLDSEGRRLGSRFPQVTVRDMVVAQKSLVDALGICKLAMVCGGSMGGMQALEWTVRFPEMVERCWMTASCRAHSAMQIGFNEAARQAIIRDPAWNGGDYQIDKTPDNGLSVARMIGHLSYLSEEAFQQKFGREKQVAGDDQFQVESYLNYQGDKFTQRFDAGSLVVLTKAIDSYFCPSLEPAQCRYLFTSFNTDWLYPSHQSKELHELAVSTGKVSSWHDISLPYGHDAFLLDGIFQGELVTKFLAS
jgi:homoserine O-acetyltransferase